MDNINIYAQKNSRTSLTDVIASTDDIFFEKKKTGMRTVLRKKLIAVQQQNQRLEQTITAKNNEIDTLKKSICSLNDVIKSFPIEDVKNNSNMASAEIVELNKRNRLLSADIASYRNKNCRLESEMRNLEIELQKALEMKKENASQNMVNSNTEDLLTRLSHTKQKLFETQNQNIELKKNLKIAQKCIQQEIGENVNLNILAASGSNWRGRAQQIMCLQIKINELKDQLESVRSVSGWSYDGKDEPAVRKEHITHRAEVDELEKVIASLSLHIEEQNRKISALKVRNNNLVADVTKMKEKCTNLETLDIKRLHGKLEEQKFHYESRIHEFQKQLTDTRDTKEEHIADLNKIIKKQKKDLISMSVDVLFECRDFRKEEFAALLGALEIEKNNLLSLNISINQRLEEERLKVDNLTDLISKSKIKICRLEAKIREFEKNHDIQMNKNKRTKRIFEYTNGITNNTNSVTSFKFENLPFNNIPSESVDSQKSNLETIDLKNQLELANEKISILEQKLDHLKVEKQNDATTFETVIRMSKTVLLNIIRQSKEE